MNRKQFLLTSIAILMALVVGAVLNNIIHVPPAQAQERLTIPKSYGTVKGSMGNGLIFEDSKGTIRLVDVSDGHRGQVFEIQRQ